MISHKECQALGFAHNKFTDRQIFPHTDACSKEKKNSSTASYLEINLFGWQIILSPVVANSQQRKEFFSD